MQYIPLIHEWIKIGIIVYACVILWLKWEDLKQIVSEESGKMSAKRIIAFMGMSTLCRLAMFTTHADDIVDNNVLAALVAIIITASSIATFVQLVGAISKLKGLIPDSKTDKTKNNEPTNV